MSTKVINKGIVKADLNEMMEAARTATVCAMAKHGGMFLEPLPEGAEGDENDEVYMHLKMALDSIDTALGVYHARHSGKFNG